MSRLQPAKLHVRYGAGVTVQGPVSPRSYTLTHSDTTGHLYLTVARAYDRRQVSGLDTRLLRDEVLAEWRTDSAQAELHVHCHVSGGLALGPAGWRYSIFQRELPLVLEAIRHGDRGLFKEHPELDRATIKVHFDSHRRRYNRVEDWGCPVDYCL
jgi:hypothetical protein